MRQYLIAPFLILFIYTQSVHSHGPAHTHKTPDANKSFAVKVMSVQKMMERDQANLGHLEELIELLIQEGRRTSHEQYFSDAEKILKPYILKNRFNDRLLLQWADILQRTHRFNQSAVVLDKLINKDANNHQARLMRAVIAYVSGDFDRAGKECSNLIGKTEMLLAVTCITQVKGMTGNLSSSIDLLEKTLNTYQADSSAVSEAERWAVTVLSEMYFRAAKVSEGRHAIGRMINKKPKDYYLLALLADSLLEQGKNTEVIRLIGENKDNDKLLLRVVIAEKSLGKHHTANRRKLNSRMHKLWHNRDEGNAGVLARYYLDVNKKIHRAVEMAKLNWRTQRGPDDILLLQRSLWAGGDSVGLSKLSGWLSQTGYEDYRLLKYENAREKS